jgi:hypothetical protein
MVGLRLAGVAESEQWLGSQGRYKHFVVCRQYAIPTTIAVGAGGGSSRAQL